MNYFDWQSLPDPPTNWVNDGMQENIPGVSKKEKITFKLCSLIFCSIPGNVIFFEVILRIPENK